MSREPRGPDLAALDDETLARRAGEGDPRAFEVLANRWWKPLGRLAAASVGYDPVRAEEVAQDALIRLHRALPSYRGGSRFSTFLWSICRHAAQDGLRARRREAARRADLPEGDRALPDPAPAPEAALEARDELDRLTRLVAGLPVEERILLHLKEAEGLGLAELARIFGRPEGTLKSRLHRIRARLAREFEEDGP